MSSATTKRSSAAAIAGLKEASWTRFSPRFLVDSTIVRAHQHAADASRQKRGAHAQGLGRSGGGLSTKIHAAGDAMKDEQQGDAPEASSESQTPHRAVTVGVAPDSAGPLGSAHQILAEITAIMRDREDQQVYWQFTSPHLGVRRSLSHSGV